MHDFFRRWLFFYTRFRLHLRGGHRAIKALQQRYEKTFVLVSLNCKIDIG